MALSCSEPSNSFVAFMQDLASAQNPLAAILDDLLQKLPSSIHMPNLAAGRMV